MALLRFSKRNPCPVCGTGTKGCSHDPEAGNYLCRGGNVTDEFTFIKWGKGQEWGVYRVTSELNQKTEFNQQQRDEYRRKKLESERIERDRLNSLLPVEERDLKIRGLLDTLTLSDRHKKELRRRGLTPEQIEAFNFKSIKRFTTYNNVDGLPGFIDGKYMGSTGIICCTRNEHNQITGFQIKTDDNTKGKYVWTTSHPVTAHLQNGELPINVVKTSTRCGQVLSTVGICEGALKPVVGATRHNVTLIGLPDNLADKQQMRAALANLNPLSSNAIVIFPDAGWLVNDNVRRSTLRNIKAIKRFGYQVKIADWGHWLSKSKQDIDEIESIEDVRYLDAGAIEEYFKDQQKYIKSWANPVEHLLAVGIDSLFDAIRDRLSIDKVTRHKLELPSEDGEWVDYKPGELPKPGTVKSVQFEGTCTEIYQEAARAGYKHILDISQTGAGKTYGAARVEPNECFLYPESEKDSQKQRKLIQLSTQSRNPNDAKLEEEFTELPARNKGYDFDEVKKTPLGNPYRVRNTDGNPDTPGNCLLTDKFQIVRNALSTVDVCGTCPFQSQCRHFEGEGYGFKAQIKKALQATKLRANPHGISPDMVSNKTIIIVDEYNQSVAWEHNFDVRLTEIDTIYGNLNRIKRDYPDLLPVLTLLEDLGDLTSFKYFQRKNIELDTRELNYGLNTTQVLRYLEMLRQESGYEFSDKAIALSEQIAEEFNHTVLTKEKKINNKVLAELLVKNWLGIVLEILSGKNPYSSLKLTEGKLAVTVRNDRIIDVFNKAKTVIFQDATGSRLDLALKLGCSVDDILLIRQKQEAPDNVIVHHVQGFGIAGNVRRKSMNQRISAARKAIALLHKSVGFIEFKRYARSGDLIHFSDARGSNLFQAMEAIASFGAPYPSLSTLHSQYEVYTGERVAVNHPNCQLYINSKVAAEVIQEIGRLRANRRKEETLHYYLCCDIDTSFLSEMGFSIQKMNAVELDVEAGDKVSKARQVIAKTYQKLLKQGKKIARITQTQLADEIGCTQANISQIAKKFGGFEKLKKAIGCMLYNSRTEYNQDLPELEEDDIYNANCYLPGVFEADWDLIATELNTYEEVYNDDLLSQVNYADILYRVPVKAVADFLEKFILILPLPHQRRFIGMCEELLE